MAATRRETVLSAIQSAHRDLIWTVREFTENDWQRTTFDEGWSRHDVLAHLASIEGRQRQQVRMALEGTATPQEPIDAYNARMVEERRTWPASRVLAEMEDEAAATEALAASMTDEQLDSVFNHPTRGPRNVETILLHMADHIHDHMAGLTGEGETPNQ